MPYSRPTLTTLKAQAVQDITGQLQGTDPLLRFSNLGIIGRVLAALINLTYGFLDWIARQAVPFTATAEYLEGWGALKGVTRKAAVAAGSIGGQPGQAQSVGNGAVIGYTLAAGTLFVRGDGVEFTSSADATVDGAGTLTVNLVAVTPGAAGNTALAQVLTLGTVVPGLNTNFSVTTALTGGADQEKDDQYRSRVLSAYQNPPQGGAVADYIRWALEVSGVTRAWVTPLGMGAGTVVVYTMWDVVEAAHNGFPQGTDGVATAEPRAAAATGDQLTVANYIYGDNTTERQPVSALVYSVAPTPNVVAFTINGIATATAATKTAIAAAIAGVFLQNGAPGATIDLSDIESAIAAVPGTEGFLITTPAGNIANPTGALPVLGVVTYT